MMAMTRVRALAAFPVAFGALAAAACDGDEGTGPSVEGATIAVLSGDSQFAAPNDTLADPLEVVVTDASGEPLEDVTIEWTVVEGGGAQILDSTAGTDSVGVASARLRLGEDLGVYRVEASVDGLTGAPASFSAEAVTAPEISDISPTPVPAGDTITIAGSGFSREADDNVVLFNFIRGTVLSASESTLEVQVPSCLPDAEVEVTTQLGAVRSNAVALDVDGGATAAEDLEVGEVVTLSDSEALTCLRIPGDEAGAAFLFVPQNATDVSGRTMPFQLAGVVGAGAPTVVDLVPSRRPAPMPEWTGFGEWASEWELRLRLRERRISPDELIHAGARRPGPRTLDTAPAQAPQIGDQVTFNVIDKDDEFVEVTAEVRYISDHAVLYQDLNSPEGGFTAANFEWFGEIFDDPIYDTDVGAFGEPSDIDGNGRIIILFTPVVNEYTEPDSEGFVAGFFYGLDLTEREGSNQAEIFYSMVPDPNGEFGDERATSDVLETAPPVLAHELQHMIHFNQRFTVSGAQEDETLWLSEGLAHMAEHLVADALEERGDPLATDFRSGNLGRALRYLKAPGEASLIAADGQGALGERGAGWLFVMHLVGHYGGTGLLTELTQTTAKGIDNVEAATGGEWATLLRDWSVALWADDAPALAGAELNERFTFPNLNLRQDFADRDTEFPLMPTELSFEGFEIAEALAAASASYLVLEHRPAADASRTLSLGLSGVRGGPFAVDARPQAMLLRIE